jgi:predicted aspartyl protease
LRIDNSEEYGLLFLIDTGADVSLLKGDKLIGATEYDPERKVKVKCVDGSPVETHGVLEARIVLGNSSIVHDFQLVIKQMDIPCDGILGRDFLQINRAKFVMSRELSP